MLDRSDDETETSNDSNDISLFSERKREHGFNRSVFTASQKVVAARPQNASACESLRKSALNSKCAGTQRQKYFISEALSSNRESRLLMLRFGAT